MRGYGLPSHIDFTEITDEIVELYGLKNGASEEKRNAGVKRSIRKAQKHKERFKTKRQINTILSYIGY